MFRSVLALGICLVLAGSPSSANDRVTVVELFTSQGCSSCPPADALLAELSKLPDLLALSEHVDYWDYLGWRDPFGSIENTQRQRAYARHLGLSYVYTPQMVVHGARHAAGTDRNSVLQLIYEAQALPQVALDVARTPKGALVARLAQTSLPAIADIWLVRFDRAHLTSVSHGENRGRQIENINVVRGFVRVAVWNGEAVSVSLPSGSSAAGEAQAILVQQSDTGRILGAARVQASAD